MSDTKFTPLRQDDANVKKVHNNDSISYGAILLLTFAFIVVSYATWLVAQYSDNNEATAKVTPPNLFIRLIGAEGLDPHASSSVPPAFHLAIDVDKVSRYYRACCGGGNSLLRISYHDMILAWGRMPPFCIDGRWSRDGVATMDAKADGAVLTEEVSGLVQSELHVVGKAEFVLEGEVTGLGYLSCKVFLFGGKATDGSKGLCQVDYY